METVRSEMLELPGCRAWVEWRRSSRARRVSLRIDPRGGAVVVTLPPRAGRQAGVSLLIDHADWVAERLAALPGSVPFAPGFEVPVHGIPHVIRHAPGMRGRGVLWLEAGEMWVTGQPEFIARRVGDFLRHEARRTLGEAVMRKATLAGVRPARVTVKDTSSRWGSCAANGNIAFSWRLVMAPPDVQDYVAAHEVAHLRHMNHGSRFWALVAELTPHMQAGSAWLRRHGPALLRLGQGGLDSLDRSLPKMSG